MREMIFSGAFARHPRLTLAIIEFELRGRPTRFPTMDHNLARRQASRGKILAEILQGVPADEQAKPAPDPDQRRPRVQFRRGAAKGPCLNNQPTPAVLA